MPISSSSKTGSARRKLSRGFPDLSGAPLTCQFCSGQEFRRSRLRNNDIRHLLMLTYPVRCLRCSERQYASLVIAALAISSSKRQARLSTQKQAAETSWSEPAERMVLRTRKDDPPA